MPTTPGRPRRLTRLARALGLDHNPLRRPSDRAEAWIRICLLAVFLIAGPVAAVGAGGWAYHHAGLAATAVRAAPTRHVDATVPQGARVPVTLGGAEQSSQARAQSRLANTAASARSGEVLAVIITLALTAFTLLAALRLTRALLGRRRLAAWETAWSRVGPQWTGGRS